MERRSQVENSSPELTAILLCGGKGERLRPFTETLPKALVPLNGEPLLSHLLRYLSSAGVCRFVVCVGYKAEAIESFLNEGWAQSGQVTCVNSGDVSMTDRLLEARPHIRGTALICYGDTLANVEIAGLVREHRRSGALATLTVYPLYSPFGIVHFDDSKQVTTFAEKPRLPYWINIGFLLCEPEAFDFVARGSGMPEFLSSLAEAGGLYTYEHRGKHLTVNTEKERALAETEMIEFFTYMDGQAE
jgi:Nucleoside-diphosphate-sugar pyrophosphorylase involved in lipopolysaccharide biosynthesis/translation initiation factor 2B, gamma/epsilon subunits (eIF-2Bgamma/eIF-2Bepsilon)